MTPNAFINDFAFVASGADVYTAEQTASGSGFSNEYDFPIGGTPESTIEVTPNGGPTGVAVTPRSFRKADPKGLRLQIASRREVECNRSASST
jgi:hypothetical protein